MTGEHAEAQDEHTSEAIGLEGLSERETVIGIRFFVAARAGNPEAARNLITQEIKAGDKKLRNEGVYNPVLEGVSIAERKDYWEKEGGPYAEALDKWRNRFTTVINQVTDPTRIAAFKSILPDDPTLKDKALNEINQDDATKLFREYSENKSDIDKFMGRAIINLTGQRVLEPNALQAHITHLRWIAAGFFGKETASMIGTQILLEVERKKDLSVAGRSVVSEFIDNNLERANNIGPEEAEILRIVHQQAVLWEEEKKKQPVGATPSAPPVVQVKDYDEEDLLPAPIEDSGTVRPQPKPQPVMDNGTAETNEFRSPGKQKPNTDMSLKAANKTAESRLGKLVSSTKRGIVKKVILGTPLAALLMSIGSIDNPNVPAPSIKEPTPSAAPLPANTIHNTDVLQPYTPQPPTKTPPPPTQQTPEPTPVPSPTPTIESTPRPTQVVKPPIPTIEATKTPSPKPKEENKWTRKWDPNVTVPVREWWDDMVAKGYINIDATAQQYAGEQINNFLKIANLVPNPVKYYLQGHGYINNCNLELDKLVIQGQGHIKITSNAYAQIPGGVECQIYSKNK